MSERFSYGISCTVSDTQTFSFVTSLFISCLGFIASFVFFLFICMSPLSIIDLNSIFI